MFPEVSLGSDTGVLCCRKHLSALDGPKCQALG